MNPNPTIPTNLWVFYDARCGLCRACRDWISRQDKFVEVIFTPYQSGLAERICPGLRRLEPDREIVVLADTGAIYQGGAAWVMCLWALREYRELGARLASPTLLPFAKRACALISRNRLRLSRFLGLRRLANEKPEDLADCPDGHCRITTPAHPASAPASVQSAHHIPSAKLPHP